MLLTQQLMFSGPKNVRPVVVHAIEVVDFNSWHHVQLVATHYCDRVSDLFLFSELVSTGWHVPGYLVGFDF